MFKLNTQILCISGIVILSLLFTGACSSGDMTISSISPAISGPSGTNLPFIPPAPQYYFSVKAVFPDNSESNYSNEISIDMSSAPTSTLVWEPPTTDPIGTPITLSDIKLFRVYAGVTSDVYLSTYEVGTVTALSLATVTLP